MHSITEASPLFGLTPQEFAAQELEFLITVIGMDEISLQHVHAMHTYLGRDVAWGMRPADMLSECDNGDLVVDFRAFHKLVASAPQLGFPYTNGERVARASDGQLGA